MRDIIEVRDGQDLLVLDTIVPKAGNVLSVQIGSLEYAPTFGIDYRFFLQSQLRFQNESFKAYLVERLAQNQVNTADVITTVDQFFEKYTFKVGDTETETRGLF